MIGSIIGAIAGPLIGGAFSAFGQSRANRAATENLQQQLGFQRASQLQQEAFGREVLGRQEAYGREVLDRQEKFGRELVGRQEAFQERSQRSRYQWTMQDMRAAGLNPILAYKQGGGGSLQGGMASLGTTSLGTPGTTGQAGASFAPRNIFSGLNDAVNSAIAAARADTTVKKGRQELRNLKAAEKNIEADTMMKSATTLMNDNFGAKAAQEFRLLREQTTTAKAAAEAAKTEQKFWESDIGQWLKRIDLTGKAINPFVKASPSYRK